MNEVGLIGMVMNDIGGDGQVKSRVLYRCYSGILLETAEPRRSCFYREAEFHPKVP